MNKQCEQSTRHAEEATTLSGDEARLVVDDEETPTGSFHILMAFHVPVPSDLGRGESD